MRVGHFFRSTRLSSRTRNFFVLMGILGLDNYSALKTASHAREMPALRLSLRGRRSGSSTAAPPGRVGFIPRPLRCVLVQTRGMHERRIALLLAAPRCKVLRGRA